MSFFFVCVICVGVVEERGAGIIFVVFTLPPDDLMMIWVSFFCWVGLFLMGSEWHVFIWLHKRQPPKHTHTDTHRDKYSKIVLTCSKSCLLRNVCFVGRIIFQSIKLPSDTRLDRTQMKLKPSRGTLTPLYVRCHVQCICVQSKIIYIN